MRPRHLLLPALLPAIILCSAPAHALVVGTGTSGSCTEAALDTALAAGNLVSFNCGAAPHTITLTSTKTLTLPTLINGGGLITLDGGHAVRHFTLGSGTYSLFGLRLANGQAASGGAIHATGTVLVLSGVTLDNNRAVDAGGSFGGAIYSAGGSAITLNLTRATNNQADHGGAIYTNGTDFLALNEFVAEANQARYNGGAVAHTGTRLTIGQSLFHNNAVTDAASTGGAIEVAPATSSTLSIVNTTFEGNTGAMAGALAVRSVGGGTINNATFANNNGGAKGTILAWGAGTQVTLTNTLVSAGLGGPNCQADAPAVLVDGGNNLQFGGSVDHSCGASIPQADPLLAPLANNGTGFFSQTMALQPGSPAINAGSGCEMVDQRGVARPIGPACDIGAFEAPLAARPGNGSVAVPALDWAGLALLSTLLAGVAALRRRRAGLL